MLVSAAIEDKNRFRFKWLWQYAVVGQGTLPAFARTTRPHVEERHFLDLEERNIGRPPRIRRRHRERCLDEIVSVLVSSFEQ
jgi:hypothetical protein